MRLPVGEAFRIGRALSVGVETLKRQPAGTLLGSFLLILTQGGSGGGGSGDGSLESGAGGGGDLGFDPAVLATIGLVAAGCAACFLLASWLFRSWLEPGYLSLHRQVQVEGSAPFTVLFSGGPAFGRMAVWKLLAGAIQLGVAALCLLPGGAVIGLPLYLDSFTPLYGVIGGLLLLVGVVGMIYVGLGLALGARAVALDDLSPMDALERSWELASDNRLHLLLFFVVMGIFTALGLLACLVGVVATRAVADAGTTEAYLRATRDDWETYALARELAPAEGPP